MALKKLESSRFIYISYCRDNYKELTHFKTLLANSGSLSEGNKDIVIDLSGSDFISSPELGAIIRLLKRLQGSRRCLRIIAGPTVKKLMNTTNVSRIKNMVVYEGQKDFKRRMKAQRTHD